MSEVNKETIENMRKAMGTLPSQKPTKTYDYVSAFDTKASHVKLVEFPENPYRSILRISTATWGDGALGENLGSCQKWEKLTPQARYIVCLSALTGNTLPTALESVNFEFEFNGVPRSSFDQFSRTRIGCGIGSIGCRDSSKLNSPFVLYPELYDEIQKDEKLKKNFEEWVIKTKDLYEQILSCGTGSWQTARAILPMSYAHSWVCTINLMALKGQMGRRLMFCEESPLVFVFWKMWHEINNKWPLMANYLRPICDNAKRCVYHSGPESLTKYFSNLFAGCGRWPDECKYAEFNHSCTNVEEFQKHIKIVNKNEWLTFTENDYYKLDQKDKNMFEQN